MTQEKPQPSELRVRASRTRKLAYTSEFKKELALSPGAIRRFLNYRAELKKAGDKKEEGGFSVERVGSNLLRFYKVTINGVAYFVKEMENSNLGVLEIHSLLLLRKLIQENKMVGISTVDFKFGFSDGRKSYFVSRWGDFLRKDLEQYMDDLSLQVDHDVQRGLLSTKKKLDDLRTRYEKLRETLGRDFIDLYRHNMSYDPVSDKIYIFDVFAKSIFPKHPARQDS